jgi:hypothetical protein
MRARGAVSPFDEEGFRDTTLLPARHALPWKSADG